MNRVVAITGVSGCGKSSLLFDVIEASLRAGHPNGCDSFALPEATQPFQAIHSSRDLGRGRTVLSALDCMPALQNLFVEQAKRDGVAAKKATFAFTGPAGRCNPCKGSGREQIAMDFMADLDLPCPTCGGGRYDAASLKVHWRGWNVAEFLQQPCSSLLEFLGDDGHRNWATPLNAMVEVGLGHLSLGRDMSSLSAGERQRVSLAAGALTSKGPALYLLDEPGKGLHESDIERLRQWLQKLVDRGHSILMSEHRLSLIAQSDWVIDLGPEGGPAGGQLIEAGPPASLRKGHTARALRAD
jgi:excinuclease ABC subunit A